MAAEFSVDVTDSANPAAKVLVFKGEFDESVLESLKAQLDPLLNDANIQALVLNFHDLEFINSKGIGFLVSMHTHLTKDGRKMLMADAQQAVMDVVSLVGLTTIIPYFATVDDAVASL